MAEHESARQASSGQASSGQVEPEAAVTGSSGGDGAPGEPPEGDPSAETRALSRRSFVLRVVGLIGGAIAAVLGIPVVGFGSGPGWRSKAPLRLLSTSVAPTRRSNELTSIGRIADFEMGVPKYTRAIRPIVDGWVREDAAVAVHVVRTGEADVTVFDPHCTHLGCPLAWSSGARSFVCPCHGGTFSSDGEVTGGPPPHALLRYDTRIQDGEVFIGALQTEG